MEEVVEIERNTMIVQTGFMLKVYVIVNNILYRQYIYIILRYYLFSSYYYEISYQHMPSACVRYCRCVMKIRPSLVKYRVLRVIVLVSCEISCAKGYRSCLFSKICFIEHLNCLFSILFHHYLVGLAPETNET
jgi:hypothetical protein